MSIDFVTEVANMHRIKPPHEYWNAGGRRLMPVSEFCSQEFYDMKEKAGKLREKIKGRDKGVVTVYPR